MSETLNLMSSYKGASLTWIIMWDSIEFIPFKLMREQYMVSGKQFKDEHTFKLEWNNLSHNNKY